MAMGKSLATILVLSMLAGCATVNSYEASIQGPGGRYDIVGRRGGLVEVVEANGARITADDRGYPDQPSALSNMASVAGAALINREAN